MLVSGTEWPVKDAWSAVSGLSRASFDSQSARRALRDLGFEIVGGSEPKALIASPGQSKLDADALPMAGDVGVSVNFTWRFAGTVELDATGRPAFPKLPSVPGLYRFDFGIDQVGMRVLYVGESGHVRKRASQYRNAVRDGGRNRTSRRIHRLLVAHLEAGGAIEYSIATTVTINGADADLRRKTARLLAESAAVHLAQLDPRVHVLNIDAEVGEV
ncbi:hypothetical protein AWU67_10250 [Microterricola viridarii]|uniref:GIY-YIG domain-containing protein n=1 Tax=Microterricola viridarii TaxID=412690 RepID=A0A109QX07_9MICO|nr:hypothetical protein AWU67_10250 [Microterricola viridarii]